jgi:hypothetical protein
VRGCADLSSNIFSQLHFVARLLAGTAELCYPQYQLAGYSRCLVEISAFAAANATPFVGR